jgi:rod shape-determining protein MreD
MKVFLFHLTAGLFLVVVQSARCPLFTGFPASYDLLVCQVLFLAFFRPLREGALFCPLMGIVMDCLSGGPFGLHLTAYLWMFVAMRWIPRYLEAGNVFFLAAACGACVFLENAFFLSAALFSGSGAVQAMGGVAILASATAGATLTGWAVILILRALERVFLSPYDALLSHESLPENRLE